MEYAAYVAHITCISYHDAIFRITVINECACKHCHCVSAHWLTLRFKYGCLLYNCEALSAQVHLQEQHLVTPVWSV